MIKKFSRNYAVVFAIIISMITLWIPGIFVWDSNPILGVDKLVGDMVITILAIFLIKNIGVWDTAGFTCKGFKKGMILGVPFIIIGVIAGVIGKIGVEWSNLKISSLLHILLFTVNMVMIGVNEEVLMRSLILNNLLHRYSSTRKDIYRAVFISALIFGAIHIPNIFFMSPVTSIVQTVNAVAAGVLFATIYILSRNIWAGIVIHAVVDWLALFVGQCFIGGESVLSVSMTIQQGGIMIILGAAPPILISFYLLGRAKLQKW